MVAADLARLAEQLLTENLLDPASGNDTAGELPPPSSAERAYQAA